MNNCISQTEASISLEGFNKPYWTALQALAWVISKDKELVSELANNFYDVRRNPVTFPSRDKAVIKEHKPPTHLRMCLLLADKGIDVYVKDYEEQIQTALYTSVLNAFGTDNTGKTSEIPSVEWYNLEIDYDGNYASKDSGFRWNDLQFSRDNVLSTWKGNGDRGLELYSGGIDVIEVEYDNITGEILNPVKSKLHSRKRKPAIIAEKIANQMLNENHIPDAITQDLYGYDGKYGNHDYKTVKAAADIAKKRLVGK